MKRLLQLQDQCIYIHKYYNRYKSDQVDMTTAKTCFDILHWMDNQEQFNNVVYAAGMQYNGKKYAEIIGNEERLELVEKLFKNKSIRHKRKTLDRCLKLLFEDMYIQEE